MWRGGIFIRKDLFKVKYEQRGSAFIKEFIQKLSGIKRSFLVPLGIGIIISAILMNISSISKFRKDVEAEARKLGMVYPIEINTVNTNPGKDWYYD